MRAGQLAYQLTFNISPIILTGGIANFIPGSMLPIISITQSLNFITGLLSGGSDLLDLDNFFANFAPMPGGTLIAQDIGRYPFANQAVAANATIQQPLQISMLMHCPARGSFGYAAKTATMIALQATLEAHNASGGTYTVATPSRFYDNCILKQLVDIGSEGNQLQSRYRWDFEQPLLTLQAAQQAQNNLMGKITGGVALPGDPPAWSGLQQTVGLPDSVAAPGVIPAASGAGGAQVAAPTTQWGHQ